MNIKRICTILAIISLLVLFIAEVVNYSRATSTTEADASVSIVEQYTTTNLDRVAAHCSVQFNDVFLNAANTIRLLRRPVSIAEAKTQLELLDRLSRVEVNQINSICESGRHKAFLARLAVTQHTDYFFDTHTGVSVDDKLLLLNRIPANQTTLVARIKNRLQKMGCNVQQVDFAYHCAIN